METGEVIGMIGLPTSAMEGVFSSALVSGFLHDNACS
jgi:hypothetical protein